MTKEIDISALQQVESELNQKKVGQIAEDAVKVEEQMTNQSESHFVTLMKKILGDQYKIVIMQPEIIGEETYLLSIKPTGYMMTVIQKDQSKDYQFDFKTNSYKHNNVNVSLDIMNKHRKQILNNMKKKTVTFKVVPK